MSSIYRVTKNDVETFSIITNPLRSYVSSSTGGVTGSVFVFARRSPFEKEVMPASAFVESVKNDSDLNSVLRSLSRQGRLVRARPDLFDSGSLISPQSSSFRRSLEGYLDKVNEQSVSARKRKALDVIRFTPSFNFTSNTMRKLVVKDILNKYYRTDMPSAHWAYTNYNSLNFFTSSMVPSGSALLYPNIPGPVPHEGYLTGTYDLSGAFSFDFYINPRYTTDAIDGVYTAGTIFHLSSSYALSLVSGSAKDENGRPIGFRLQLQLSRSADIPPSRATASLDPSNFVFQSDDNSLLFNRWHHCVVRWGTNLLNQGTGSFNIDQVERGEFVVPVSTLAYPTGTIDQPAVLSIGNYLECRIGDGISFFAADPALRDGLNELDATTSVEEPIPSAGSGGDPNGYKMAHPLNAELHDLTIKRYYMSDADIAASASMGPVSVDANLIAFYLPPFFVSDSPFRQFVGDHGGILQTPFFEVDGTTNDPFNVAMSFGVGGHYINIENFVRDFASNVFPRVHLMTGTADTHTTEPRSANEFLYDDALVRRRNLFIMPCDDGNFVPRYELLVSESLTGSVPSSYVDDLGVEEFSFIHLDELVLTQSVLFGTSFESANKTDNQANDYVNEAVGFTPEQPGSQPGPAFLRYANDVALAVETGSFDPGIQMGAPLTIFQRTRDPSSNQVTFFDISNLFYGKRILPKSFTLHDPNLSGSGGPISITLKDDGQGNIYRADSLTSASTWNSVGNIYYDEGIVVIKSPHLYFFGKEGYEMSFRGDQSVHVLKLNVLAPSNQLNQSHNPNFKPVHPSGDPNDPDTEFVYITGLNFHDNNYNVVAKAQVVQPVLKRHGDRIAFKVKLDF